MLQMHYGFLEYLKAFRYVFKGIFHVFTSKWFSLNIFPCISGKLVDKSRRGHHSFFTKYFHEKVVCTKYFPMYQQACVIPVLHVQPMGPQLAIIVGALCFSPFPAHKRLRNNGPNWLIARIWLPKLRSQDFGSHLVPKFANIS